MHTLPQNKDKGKVVVLSERLSAIAESLPDHAVVCDVGSDHGDLPLSLLQMKKSPRVIVTDLNPLPLSRAKKNIENAGYLELAQFVLTDGIEEVIPFDPDVFVIAGMGGETIAGILDRALSRLCVGMRFVLQPMTKVSVLREFLYENGFLIQNERIIYENHKFFPVLWVEYDAVKRLEKQKFSCVGEHVILDRSEETKLYFEKLLKQINQKICGKKKANADISQEEIEKNQLELLVKEFYEDSRN